LTGSPFTSRIAYLIHVKFIVSKIEEYIPMNKIKPLSNRVLVKRSKATTSKGGIILPDTAQEKPKEGEVIAVGPGVRDEDGNLHPLTVKVGDHILFSSYAGTEVKDGQSEDEFLILSEEDILGVLVEK
jgi:chaperonin GroES